MVFVHLTAEGVEISRADIIDALSMKYGVSSDKFTVTDLSDQVSSELTQKMSNKELLILVEEIDRKLKQSEKVASAAHESIDSLRKQQQDLFDEFVVLRQRYDEQKNVTMQVLWSHLGEHHPQVTTLLIVSLRLYFSHAHIFEYS